MRNVEKRIEKPDPAAVQSGPLEGAGDRFPLAGHIPVRNSADRPFCLARKALGGTETHKKDNIKKRTKGKKVK